MKMKKEIIKINGMTCHHCIKAVEDELVKLPLRYFSVAIGNVTAEFDESVTNAEEIKQAIIDAGYGIAEINTSA